MKGIYIENNTYKTSEVTPAELEALHKLGVEVELHVREGYLKILSDTSEQDHSFCDDEDAISFMKHKRMQLIARDSE